MKEFWAGFEKRALSPELLRRAASSAKQKASDILKLPLRKMLASEGELAKREAQRQKFSLAASEKEFLKNLEGHKASLKTKLDEDTEKHLDTMKRFLK